MHTFGTLFKVAVFGASHASHVGVNIDGVPPGLPINETDFSLALSRRQGGNQKGTTPRKEADEPMLLSGVYNQFSTGAPLTIAFTNNNTQSKDYKQQEAIPRPSHADWVANERFKGFQDIRGGGAFSARLTVGIVAAGVIAQKIFVEHYKIPIQILAKVDSVGGFKNTEEGLAFAIAQKDSVGAIVACDIRGVPVGLGEPFWDSVESVMAHAMFAIPAVRGIEFGMGFAAASMTGKTHNDAIIHKNGKTASNNAGGIVGGLTNGNDIHFKLAFKPTASTPQLQESINMLTGNVEAFKIKGRHDLCVALRAPVIVEAMAWIVLLDLYKQWLAHQ